METNLTMEKRKNKLSGPLSEDPTSKQIYAISNRFGVTVASIWKHLRSLIRNKNYEVSEAIEETIKQLEEDERNDTS